jgi:Zn-dependent peptidase ImmA (M78 family)
MEMWSKFLGDTSRFGFEIKFMPDPDKGLAATQEESASWGALKIWVNGTNLCSHYEEGEQIEGVHWYLLPFLEWLVVNWNPLFHEEHLPFGEPARNASIQLIRKQSNLAWLDDDAAEKDESILYEWWLRHNLQASRQGGLFPNISIRRWRELVEVSWEDVRLPGTPDGVFFASPKGFYRLEPQAIAGPLYAVVGEAIEFLANKMPLSERLTKLKKSVATISTPQSQIRLAWMAGLGHLWPEIEERWSAFSQKLTSLSKKAVDAILRPEFDSPVILGSCKASLMFGSVSPTIGVDDAMCIAQSLVTLFDERGDLTSLSKIAHEIPLSSDDSEPWNQGYRLALEMLDTFGVDTTKYVDVKAVMETAGVFFDAIALSDEKIRAVAIAGPQHRASVLLNRSHYAYTNVSWERFTFAHELCHLLFDRSYGKSVALASGPWAPSDLEARANAFAAMFLMPRPLIETFAKDSAVPLDSVEGVDSLANKLGTSFGATVEHLCNLRYFDAATRDQIKDQKFERRPTH